MIIVWVVGDFIVENEKLPQTRQGVDGSLNGVSKALNACVRQADCHRFHPIQSFNLGESVTTYLKRKFSPK